MIDVEAINREIQDRWDRMANEMDEQLPSEQFLSYLPADEVMALFTSSLEDRSERCLKQALIDMAIYAYEAWDAEIEAKKDAYHDFKLDQHGVDRFGSAAAGHKAWHEHKARKAA